MFGRKGKNQGEEDDAWNFAQYERERKGGISLPFSFNRRTKAILLFFILYILVTLLTPLIPITGDGALTGYLVRTVAGAFRFVLSAGLAIWFGRSIYKQLKWNKAAAGAGYPGHFLVRPLSLLMGLLLLFFTFSNGINTGLGFIVMAKILKAVPAMKPFPCWRSAMAAAGD